MVIRWIAQFAAFALLLSTAVLADTASEPVDEKSTRQEIIAYADECTAKRVKMDFVGRFGTNFRGLDLSGVNFRGGYQASGTNLRGADFTDANLTGADFDFSILDGADFTGADLTDARFYHASMRNVTLKNVNVSGTRFYASKLAEAKMAGINLSQSHIGVAHFGGADLSGSTLAGADTVGYAPLGFQNANLTDAELHGLKLDRANFQDAILRRANLSGCQLEAADFTGADLQDARLQNAYIAGAVFRNVKGLSDAETQRLTRAAARWRFLLKEYIIAFLDSFAFAVFLLLVAAALVIATVAVHRRRKRLRPDVPARPTWYQFSLSSLLLLTLAICSFIGVFLLSPIGAYSYGMFLAFCMMVIEVIRGHSSRKFSIGLLTAALLYVPLNLTMFWAAGYFADPFFLFDLKFRIAMVFVGPALVIAGAIAAAIIAWRSKTRIPALSLIGFCIWIVGVGFGNILLIGMVAASV